MIGLVTIGQAPRNDITASMFEDDSVRQIIQFGALDGQSKADIKALKPGLEDSVLVSRLSDGKEVELGKRLVTPLVQNAINRALSDGASVVCVLCTGAFVGLTANVPIIYPDQVLLGVVGALLPAGRLGVLVPHEGQRVEMIRKWSSKRRDVVTGAVSPYTAVEALAGETQRPCESGAELMVMDCMGFTRGMEHTVRAAADGIPVILSNGIVGAVIREVWGLQRTH